MKNVIHANEYNAYIDKTTVDPIFSSYKDGCYYNNNGTYVEHVNYKTFYLNPIEYRYSIYFANAYTYTQICIFSSDQPSKDTFIKRYRTEHELTDGTIEPSSLPMDPNNPIFIEPGQYVAITIDTVGASVNLITSYTCDYIINDKIFDPILSYCDKIYDTGSDYENTYSGYDSANGIIDYVDYVSYGFTVSKSTNLYFSEYNGAYISVTVYNDADTLKNGTRYRCKSGEGDTLPLIDNPIHVEKGNYIVFSTDHYSNFKCVLKDYGQVLNQNIVVDEKQISGLVDKIGKKCYLLYRTTTQTNYQEYLYIYIPSKVGYMRYLFNHVNNDTINANVWHIGGLDAVSDKFANRFAITTPGEWECAIRLSSRDDFSGGNAHGDEILTDIVFLLDGVNIDPSTITDKTEFNELRIIQRSELYDPADHTTVIAIHASEHVFVENKLYINQTVTWKVDADVIVAYLAMHCPAKAVTNKIYNNKTFEITDLTDKSGFNMNFNGATSATVFSDNSGVIAKFYITKYPSGYPGGDRLNCRDNNGGIYNKCYYNIIDSSAVNIKSGTVWESETVYEFVVGK